MHGDPKLGNLGHAADGRAVLLDWAYPGAGPFAWDLAWYLALNAVRLPEPKEAAATAYAASLQRRRISTDGCSDNSACRPTATSLVGSSWLAYRKIDARFAADRA